jgi:hypothetical protein
VRREFRERFCAALEAMLRGGELELPADLATAEALRIVAQARRRKWNVRLEAPYRHGEGVAIYLARYLKGGPLKNRRLVGFDGETVTFRYGEFREADASGRPKEKTLRLTVSEFLGRWLCHVPPPGLKMVRSYGLYAPRSREALERARAAIEPSPDWTAAHRRLEARRDGGPAPSRCPKCGRALVVRRTPRISAISLRAPPLPGGMPA